MIKKHAPFELEDNCEFFVKHIFHACAINSFFYFLIQIAGILDNNINCIKIVFYLSFYFKKQCCQHHKIPIPHVKLHCIYKNL
jgi:hypothetical protein